MALERIADCQEMQLIDQGYTIRPQKSNTPDSMDYVDEEMDYVRENFMPKSKIGGDDE